MTAQSASLCILMCSVGGIMHFDVKRVIKKAMKSFLYISFFSANEQMQNYCMQWYVFLQPFIRRVVINYSILPSLTRFVVSADCLYIGIMLFAVHWRSCVHLSYTGRLLTIILIIYFPS